MSNSREKNKQSDKNTTKNPESLDHPSMKINIYGGNKIGGCVTEISTNKTKLIFDYGLNLDDTAQIDIDGLTSGKVNYNAVFISHYHGDHIGNISKILPEIPIYIEEVTFRIYEVMNGFSRDKIALEKLNIITFKLGEEITINNLKITSYIVDHSAYNACMFFVTDGKEKAIYTGDYRDNGKKGKLLIPTVKKLAPIDYLITEATTKGSNTHSLKKESDLSTEFIEVFNKYDQILILMSTANIDRIPTIYRAARDTNHNYIQDLYMAHVTSAIKEKIPNPLSFANVYVYKPQCYLHSKDQDFKTKYVDNSFNEKNDVKKLFEPFVMNIRQSFGESYNRKRDLNKLKEKGALNNACLVYSMWGGYKEKEDMAKFLSQVQELGIDIIDIHATGHASEEVINKVIKTSGVKQDNVYFIHTNYTNNQLRKGK